MTELTLQGLQQLAEEMWEGGNHCYETDKEMWINGFVNGYLHAESNNDDEENDKEINPVI